MRIDYTIVFDRSWRIGSGEAAGRHLDSLLRRDALGLPFVPGSTVRGLARDAARRLARALAIEVCDGTLGEDQGAAGRLCGVNRSGLCPLCALFGSPHREPGVGWGPARIVLAGAGGPVWEGEARSTLAQEAAQVPNLLTRGRSRTAVDEKSGRAADEQLFTQEEAVAGLELSGALEVEAALAPREVSLLVAALCFLREVGGGRRRGLGACRVRIAAADLTPAFATWEDAVRALAAPPEPARELTAPAAPSPARPSGRTPARLQVDARVVGEVVAGGRPEAGNRIAGLPFLAGSALRGALAARWRGDRAGAQFERCFLSG
ncbi:MAG TPA: RAMP superfamily CRISPR-associated protein, partial [Thermoanaerobaculia bacterium]|nr:RAMP superfamily CRISPR-associated protein [Thermoanaerobaculia bacterium]